jgi:hypothetical protein
MQIGGGLGEEYMHAPSLNVGGGGGQKGGGGFIANLLDLLGIHKQVAKGPKDTKGGESASPAGHVTPTGGAPAFTPGAPTATSSAPPPPVMHLLDSADEAFSAIRPRAGKMGLGFLPEALK